MTTSFGLDYLLRFSKIQAGEIIGDIEAVEFKSINEAKQMGDLIITCRCHKFKKDFKIKASILNWKITKFRKGSLSSLDYATVRKLDQQ